MQNTNKKPLSELIKEADEKRVLLVIVGAGAETGKHADLYAKMKEKPDRVMLVNEEDLLEEDRKKLGEDKGLELFRKDAFLPEPIPIKNYHEPIPEIKIKKDDMKKEWYEKFVKGKKGRKF